MENAMLELLWVESEDEARSPPAQTLIASSRRIRAGVTADGLPYHASGLVQDLLNARA
jgi:hypothetical protein